ncbi:hypothetical protein [Candidatus Nitrospira inopinata]|uniref:MotA/TolQ/ExbB proton channel domain-containing protein n=1 Tax=Candidatus Nitrospira inopinata TaxID=1715989 RepID=A0A0S4KTK6_9BACT|nr:hypothetical protein [Candidatus Nitrospira inopinata]CUQ65734.1 protein of unknown function [Candidatus Nitrospira inopinata]
MSTMVDLLLHPFTDANPIGLVTAPGLSWVGSAGIIVVTLAVLTWMVVKVWMVRQPLTVVATELQKLRHQHSVLDAEGLNRLDGLFGKVEPLAQAWEEFRETVLVKDSPGKIYNTRPAEEFFTEDNLINQRINLFFYSSFPGIVTGVGLLLTFLAIFAGLLQVNIDEESSRIEGISGLINGLAGKFLTSIVALSCATVYLLLEKPLVHGLSNSYYRFTHALNRLLSRRTSEHILEDMHQNLAEQTTAFRHFGVDLSTRLKEGISESLGPTLRRMVEVVERLATQQRQDNNDAIKELIAQFLKGLEGTTKTQFTELQTVLASASNRMEELNRAGEESRVGLATFIQRLDDSMAAQNRAVSDQIGQLRETVGSVLARLENVGSEHERRAHELLASVTTTIREAQEHSQAHLSKTVDIVLQRTAKWTEQGAMNLMAALDEHRSASQQLAQTKSVLNEALESFRAMVTEGQQALKQVEQAAYTLLEGQRSFAATVQEMRQLQEQAGQNAERLAQQLTRFAEIHAVQTETLKQFQTVFHTVETGLGNVLTELTHSMERYSSVVQEYTEQQLTRFDESFSQAAQELKASSDMVRDGLQQVTGPLEKLVKRIE